MISDINRTSFMNNSSCVVTEIPHLDMTLSYPQTAGLLLLAFVGLVENVILCLVICTQRKLRKRITYMYVVSLTITQIVVAGLVLPLHCFLRCHYVYSYITAFGVMSYISNLCAVTHERYIAIKRPLRYNQIMTHAKARRVITLCWLTSAITQFLPVTWSRSMHAIYIQKIYMCFVLVIYLIVPLFYLLVKYTVILLEVRALCKRDKNRAHSVTPSTPSYEPSTPSTPEASVILFTTHIATYSCDTIFNENVNDDRNNTRKLSNAKQGAINRKSIACVTRLSIIASKVKKEGKVAFVFAIIAITYTTTWLPVLYMTFLMVIERLDYEPESLNDISIFLVAGNCIIDPMVYGLYLAEIRSSARDSFQRFFRKLK